MMQTKKNILPALILLLLYVLACSLVTINLCSCKKMSTANLNIDYPGSRYLDSLGLVSIYMQLNGTNWPKSSYWLSNKPLEQWQGISIVNNRVDSIGFNLSMSNLVSGNLKFPNGDTLYLLRKWYLGSTNINIVEVPAGALPSLTDLYMNNSAISSIIMAPNSLVNLSSLSISYCSKLTNFSLVENTLNNLKILGISYNKTLSRISFATNSLNNLIYLSLKGCGMLTTTDLDFSPGSLGNLRGLYLSGSGFTGALDLSNITAKLNYLDLRATNIAALTLHTNATNNLYYLDIRSDPSLTSFPIPAGSFNNLNFLALDSSGITALNVPANTMNNLKYLSLKQNQYLATFTYGLNSLTNLKYLFLDSTGLTNFTAYANNVNAFDSVQYLNLSYTPITTFTWWNGAVDVYMKNLYFTETPFAMSANKNGIQAQFPNATIVWQ
ncbi:MAG: hypothetical protein QM528_05795 [Phycisphaerales bacterium]|nr:hypothetical protein [Phycisphaerales bacterium]